MDLAVDLLPTIACLDEYFRARLLRRSIRQFAGCVLLVVAFQIVITLQAQLARYSMLNKFSTD